MRTMTKDFNRFLNIIEETIERARQKEMYNRALEETEHAIGCIRLAFFLDIIDLKEFELLLNKFFDYQTYYTMLLK